MTIIRATILAGLAVAVSTPALSLNFSDTGGWHAATALTRVATKRGDPVKVTWSIAPDGAIDAYTSMASNLPAKLSAKYGPDYMKLFRTVFSRMGEVSGLQFIETKDDGARVGEATPGLSGVRGDFRMVGCDLDAWNAKAGTSGGEQGWCNCPGSSGAVIMMIHTGNLQAAYDMELQIIMHEVGHGTGFGHQTIWESPSATTEYRQPNEGYGSITGFRNSNGPQFDDVYAMHRMYGDQWERNGGNDTLKTATDIGNPAEKPLSLGTQINGLAIAPTETDFLSIDGTSDRDNFKFRLTHKSKVSVTVTPKGPTYDYAPEGGKRKTFEASRQSDLLFDLCNVNGVSLAHVNSGGLGDPESVTKTLPAGSYIIIVKGTQDANQFYRLDVTAEAT